MTAGRKEATSLANLGKICLTAVLSYAALFLIAKLIGRKQISQLDSFDYITGITIGSIAAELATNLEDAWKPFLALILYGLITYLMSLLGIRYSRSRKYLNGSPVIVMDNGKLYRENMKSVKLDLSEFMVMCRQQGYFHLSDIQTAVFEFNGKLSILPVSTCRPATPGDLNLSPEQTRISTEVIMDGRILEENLKRMGFDRNWLNKRLKEQGIRSANEVFLGICDSSGNLVFYQNSD